MATGKRVKAAQGEGTALDGLPDKFAHVVERCLAREPECRWQSASDVKAELEWAGKSQAPALASRSLPLPRWLWAVAALACVGLGVLAVGLLSRESPQAPERVYRASILLPPNAPLSAFRAERFALSPDGRRLAIAAGTRLWVRSLD